MNDVKRTKNSIVIGFILFFFVGALNAMKMLVLIRQSGVMYNGIYQTFAQIFAYLSILELGLGVATVSSLYKPVIDDNKNQIAGVLLGMRKTFFKISAATVILAIVAIPLFLFIFRTIPMEVTLIMLTSLVLRIILPYICYDGFALMIAENKSYNVTIATSVITILASITLMTTVFVTKQFVLAYIFENTVIVLGYYISNQIFKKQYPNIYKVTASPYFPFLKELRGAATFKLTDTISNNTDVIVITTILGANFGSSFASYNATAAILFLIVSTTIIDAIKSLLGKMYASNESEKGFNKTVQTIKVYNFLLISIVIPMLAIFLKPFTDMFFSSPDMVQQSYTFIFCFCLYFYLRMTRTPYQALKVAQNKYNDFRVVSLINAILNLTLSIVFTMFFGVIGVLLGSTVALLLTEYWYDIVKLEIEPGRNNWRVVISQLFINITLVVILSLIGIKVITPFLSNLVILICASIPTLFLLIGLNYMVYRLIQPNVELKQIFKK